MPESCHCFDEAGSFGCCSGKCSVGGDHPGVEFGGEGKVDAVGDTFADLRLAPGADVTLFSGCGPDDESNRYWCVSGSAVWNNSGDTVFLRDPNGNIVASLSYGDSG